MKTISSYKGDWKFIPITKSSSKVRQYYHIIINDSRITIIQDNDNVLAIGKMSKNDSEYDNVHIAYRLVSNDANSFQFLIFHDGHAQLTHYGYGIPIRWTTYGSLQSLC